MSGSSLATKPQKPLGQKAYGFIPHLPGSRLGPSDKQANPGQAGYLLGLKMGPSRPTSRIIVTLKIDGTNMSIANIGGRLVALGRAGYRASDSPFRHVRLFDVWVYKNQERLLEIIQPGEHLSGEWLLAAAGTLYDLQSEDELFWAFDLWETKDASKKRLGYDVLWERCSKAGVKVAPLLYTGLRGISIERALDLISVNQSLKLQPGEVHEGAVWRREQGGEFRDIAKYVRPEKKDGVFLPGTESSITTETIWLWPLEKLMS